VYYKKEEIWPKSEFWQKEEHMPNYQPFIGFTYNEKHSIDDLHIYRTSNGNRYDENLTPTMADKVVDVPGGDGQYYFGTTFKNRTFTVSYAFDNLKKADITEMKRVFSGDGIHELVFDEDRGADGKALKIWSAKVTGTATMKHLCFEENGKDIYKGEGSITFTCYYPYARSENKGMHAFNTINTEFCNNGDLPAPFIGRFRRYKAESSEGSSNYRMNSSDIIYGVSYSDGSGNLSTVDIYFATSRQVGGGWYEWNSKTGIVSYLDNDGTKTIIPIPDNAIVNIPVKAPIGSFWFLTSAPGATSRGSKYAKVLNDSETVSGVTVPPSEFRELYR
jgi:hypothetical protein